MCCTLVSRLAHKRVSSVLLSFPDRYACERGHTGVIDTLVQGGADPTVTDEEGRTCLHVASMSGHAAICAFLINECQLDPNQRDLGGRTPLHTAVYSLDVATTEALIAAGANVDAQDGEGISALHWAASRGSVGCLDLLLEASCFPNHTECVLLQFWCDLPRDDCDGSGNSPCCCALYLFAAVCQVPP